MPPPSDVTTGGSAPLADRYVPIRLLGRGGMGDVFLAHDLIADRPVAVKVVSDTCFPHSVLHQRLIREGHLGAGLRHPNICAIYDVGTTGDRPFIVMEYIAGETLCVRSRRRRLSTTEISSVARQLGAALEAARRSRVVHRDLKPTNIVLTADGTVKVLDFGLAQIEASADAAATADARPSDRGMIVGTAEYISPEQALGRRTDHRSDLFSLGVVLYELLTGRLPFDGGTTLEHLWTVVNSDPSAIDDGGDPARAALAASVMRLLAKNPDRRYQTAQELLADLQAIGRARVRPSAPAPRRAGRVLRPVGGVAAGLMFTVGGLVPGTLWLTEAAETAWTEATDRRTSVWMGDAAGTRMSAVLSATVSPDAFWLGNAGRVVYSTTRSRGRGAVWAVDRPGATPRVVAEQAIDSSVTPDGRVVVFRKDAAGGGLWRLDLHTGANGLLMPGEVAHPTVLPDGKTVVFERLENGSWTLWSVPVTGGRPAQLSDRAPGSRPIIAPDGRRVAFETNAGVVVCSLPDCRDDRLLPIGSPRAWTPDGRGLAYIGSPNGANVWVADVITGARRQLTRFTDRAVTNIAWSPDGKRLAVTRLTSLSELALLPARARP